MWLLIDDTRDLNCDLIARTADVGKQALIAFQDDIECLCLDHDLGEEQTGYDIAKWMVEKGFAPKRVQIVSSNPVGRNNIAEVLLHSGYTTTSRVDFYKG